MKIDFEFIELHTSLFLGGVNFGLKLYPTSKGGLDMYYDTDLKHYVVIYKTHVAMIRDVASATLKNPSHIGVELCEKPGHTMTLKLTQQEDALAPTSTTPVKAQATGPEKTIRTAQVSTPHSKPPKAPGRPAKYQGEESQGE